MKRPKSGASGIADILKGLGDLVDRLSDIEQEVASRSAVNGGRQPGESAESKGEFRSADGRLRGIFGVNVKVGLGGKEIQMEPFGHTQNPAKEPGATAEVHELREPLCDVFEEGSEILIVAEMPGVSAKDLKLDCEGDLLTLRAANAHRRYAKEIQLPALVDLGEVKIIENNGVMEIRCPKKA